jgi:hypothetical protein
MRATAQPAKVVRVSIGSWLCENSETRNRDRTNTSSKPRVQCAKIVRVFSSDQSEKNILVAFQFFAFLHTQRQSRLGGASCRSSHVRNAPLATVGPKKAACRDGPNCDMLCLNRTCRRLSDFARVAGLLLMSFPNQTRRSPITLSRNLQVAGYARARPSLGPWQS